MLRVALLVWAIKSLMLSSQLTAAIQPVRSVAATPTETILADIRNAFKVVTNNTGIINHLIPEMYRPAMRQQHSVFRFVIPNAHAAKGYTMWSMQRTELVDPVFPNLTLSYMRAQLKKRQRPAQIATATPKPTPAATSSIEREKAENVAAMSGEMQQQQQQQQQASTWSALGLDGWSGAIAPAIAEVQLNSEYPADDILMDFEFEEAQYHSTTPLLGIGEVQQHDSESVYIARVNDPFGSSVKWERRNSTDDRAKRDIVTLYSMLQCSTGCQPLMYKAYGCFCGFLGAGVPVDGIDRCCKLHDKCYEHSNCISYLQYFVPYVWKCYRGKPLCAIDHGEFGGPNSCAARLCYCDLALSRCLRRFTCPQRRAVCTSSRIRRLQNLLLAFK